MPTYEYRCPDGHEFDLFQRMSDPPEAVCPECGKKAERLLSAGAGFLFKGEGFYITDYRSDSYRKAAEAEKKAPASSNGDSKAKKDGASKKGGASGKDAPSKKGGSKASGSGTPSSGSKD
jgi:putative FmdB family regulatory protein